MSTSLPTLPTVPPALPPSGAPPALTPGGRSAFRGVLVAVAIVVVAGTLVALGAGAWGLSTIRVVADGKPLPADMRSLTIDARDVSAALRIETTDDATEPRVSMRVVESAREAGQVLDVAVSGQDARVVVRGGEPNLLGWGRVGEITVTLPTALAARLSITTQQDTGVLLARADVDTLTASNEDGAIVLSGAARRVDVRTGSADISTHHPIAVRESFVASSIDGGVSVEFTGPPPRTIEATTADGDVTVRVPDPGPYEVRASGETTRIRVPQTSDPAAAVARISARSGSGTTVVEPAGADGRHPHG